MNSLRRGSFLHEFLTQCVIHFLISGVIVCEIFPVQP